MKASLRIALAVVLLQLFSLLLQGFLDVYKYSTLLTDLVRSRLEVVALDIKANLEATVALGLALSETSNADEMIKRMRQQDALIKRIAIFEVTGTRSIAVYDTDSASVKTEIPASWQKLNLRSGDDPWGLEEGLDTQVVGVPIRDHLGRTIGGIAIRFDSSALRARHDAMVRAMVQAVLPILSIAVLFGLLSTLLLMSKLQAEVKALGDVFQDDGTLLHRDQASPVGAHPLARIPEVIQALAQSEAELSSARGGGHQEGA